MIEDRSCYFLLCDECPDDEQVEESEHVSFRLDVVDLALRYGWLVEKDDSGDDYHVCPFCQTRRTYEKCRLDGGHDPVLEGTFSDGTRAYRCKCGHPEFHKPEAVIDKD